MKDVLPLAYSAEQTPVKVHIHTTIWSEDDKQTIELTVLGRLYKKETSSFLQYEEVHEEGKMNIIIKFTKNEVFIMRNGLFKMRMHFRERERLKGTYETPYGNLTILTKTKRINHEFDEKSSIGTIDLLYDLHMEGSPKNTHHLQVNYEEVPE